MLRQMVSVLFNAAVLITALGGAVWLFASGNAAFLEGLLLAKLGFIAAMVFAFRLAESVGPGQLSIWAGPLRLRPGRGSADESRLAGKGANAT